MFKKKKIPRNLWIVLFTVILILAGYFLYFRVYLESKEQKIAVSHFRMLNQTGESIREINNVYIRNEQNYLEKVIIAAGRIQDTGYSGDVITGHDLKNENPALKKLNNNISVSFIFKKEGDKSSYISSVVSESDRSQIVHPYEIRDPAGWAVFTYSLGSILNIPASQQLFDGLLVIRAKEIAYNSLNADLELSGMSSDRSEPYRSSENNILLPGDESDNLYRMFAGSRQLVSIDDVEYQLFLKPLKINNENWYLGGLVKNSDYMAGIRTLDPWLVILLSVILVLMFLGLPILKLKLMSRLEHLYTSTIVTSALSVMLGSAFLTLLLYYTFHQPSIAKSTDRKLETLADTIEGSFYLEIESMNKQLAQYDRHFNDIFPDLSHNAFLNNVLNTSYYETKLSTLDDTMVRNFPDTSLWDPVFYPWFDYVFWTKKNGQQVAEIFTYDNDRSNLINVGTRNYIRSNNAWLLPSSHHEPGYDRFRIESIYSYTSGIAKAGLGIPSTGSPIIYQQEADGQTAVAAMTARMYSITNTILPPGYDFAIADESGTVWFHSDPSRNMQENVFNETDNNKYLKGALYANTSKAINVKYYNKPHRVFIRPLKNMPLYLIVFGDKQNRQMEQVQVITVTMAWFGILFLLIFLIIAMLLIIERRKAKKRNINLIYHLCRPHTKFKRHYKQLITDNSLIFIITVVFTVFAEPLTAVAIVFPGVLITALHNYSVFNNRYADGHPGRFLLPFYIIPVLLLNLLYLVLVRFEPSSPLFFVYQVTIFVMIILRVALLRVQKSSDISRTYLVYLVTLMVIMSVLPILVFSSRIARYEDIIRIRHEQIHLVKSIEKRNVLLKEYYSGIDDPERRYEFKRREKGLYTEFNDHTKVMTLPTDSAVLNNGGREHHLLDSLMCFLRLFYTEEDVESKYLVFDQSHHNTFKWTSGDDTVRLHHLNTYPSEKTTLLTIRSVLPREIPLLPYSGEKWSTLAVNLTFIIIFAGVIYTLFLIVRYGVNVLFPLKVSRISKSVPFHSILVRSVNSSRLISLKKSSARQSAETIIPIFSEEFDVEYVDLGIPGTGLKRSGKNKKHLLIIDNAENLFTDENMLKQLIRYRTDKFGSKIVLVHSCDPIRMREVQRKIVQSPEVRDHWKSFMVNSHRIDMPIYTRNMESDLLTCTGDVCRELLSCDFLAERKAMFLPEFENVDEAHDSLDYEKFMDRLIMVASDYYGDLLNSCNDEEKYILYDIAKDLIINPKNTPVILALIRKGILKSKPDGIEILNESFRRFLLRTVNEAEVRKMESRIFHSGTWNSYRAVLVVVLIGLFIFLWLGNEAFLENLNRLFVILGAAIATVTGVLGFLSKSRKSAGER